MPSDLFNIRLEPDLREALEREAKDRGVGIATVLKGYAREAYGLGPGPTRETAGGRPRKEPLPPQPVVDDAADAAFLARDLGIPAVVAQKLLRR